MSPSLRSLPQVASEKAPSFHWGPATHSSVVKRQVSGERCATLGLAQNPEQDAGAQSESKSEELFPEWSWLQPFREEPGKMWQELPKEYTVALILSVLGIRPLGVIFKHKNKFLPVSAHHSVICFKFIIGHQKYACIRIEM